MANTDAAPEQNSKPAGSRPAAWEDFGLDYKNFGSVDLNLSPTWDRDAQTQTLLSASVIGHVNGKADAFLRSDPNAKHQFSWVERGDKVGEAMRRQQGYALVIADAWVKNPLLWEWEAEGAGSSKVQYCVNYNDRLWARPESKFLADKERREQKSAERYDTDAELARHPGAVVRTDQFGTPLRPTTR